MGICSSSLAARSWTLDLRPHAISVTVSHPRWHLFFALCLCSVLASLWIELPARAPPRSGAFWVRNRVAVDPTPICGSGPCRHPALIVRSRHTLFTIALLYWSISPRYHGTSLRSVHRKSIVIIAVEMNTSVKTVKTSKKSPQMTIVISWDFLGT